jgi:CRISPR/Cas system-associated endonuclease Cas1
VNVLLNFGYWRLHAHIWSLADRIGLMPWAGLLHVGRRAGTGLISDLMEPFRAPAVDRVVLGLLGRGFVVKQRPDGGLRTSSRMAFERAFTRNLARVVRGTPLRDEIHSQMVAFRRALDARATFRPFAATW